MNIYTAHLFKSGIVLSRFLLGIAAVLPGLTGLLLAGCCSCSSPRTPVDQFYTAYLNLHPSGLPTRGQEQTLAPSLSARLLRLINEARSCQDKFKKMYPGEKPPWVDGCLFAGLFEGPQSYRITAVDGNQDGASAVTVRFRYDTYEWQDTVIVRQEDGRYVIDDFVMSGAGPFNPPHRFSEGLRCPGE